ncbi:MAG TPA: N-acetyltransferase [Polyangiaceae bacterium]|nr:N-acetyltransferase [Polyangiaceae bacterium]
MYGSAPPALRVLTSADAAAYNAFLSEGVLAHPDTLRISPGDIARAPFKTEGGAEGCTFAACADDGTWLGVVTVEREAGREKRRHIAWIYRMYVARSASGRGIGRALLQAALGRARELPGVTKVNLTVAAHNERAVALYESAGFREFAREPDAFRDEVPRTELSMTCVL